MTIPLLQPLILLWSQPVLGGVKTSKNELNCGVQASLGAVRVFLSSGGKWALEHTGSVVAVWLQGMWDLSCHSRIEPGSPKLEGRFLTTGPRILKKIFE